jgi:hypothetical protein
MAGPPFEKQLSNDHTLAPANLIEIKSGFFCAAFAENVGAIGTGAAQDRLGIDQPGNVQQQQGPIGRDSGVSGFGSRSGGCEVRRAFVFINLAAIVLTQPTQPVV